MHNKFFIADTHFGHSNCLTFKRKDGSPLRPFTSVEEMDESMVDNWNRVVRTVDTVYVLGDVVIHRKAMPILGRLNGHKRLIMGNHDIFPNEEYLKYFEKLAAYRVFNDTPKKFICSHVPIHEESLSRWAANVHGHLHSNVVLSSPHHPDPRYVCVSVEHTNYTPIELEELLKLIP